MRGEGICPVFRRLDIADWNDSVRWFNRRRLGIRTARARRGLGLMVRAVRLSDVRASFARTMGVRVD
jgi:hypothetical protein